jgi:hypothetical protein
MTAPPGMCTKISTAEPDERKQRPEADPRDPGQIGAGGMADGAAGGDEQGRGTAGLPVPTRTLYPKIW